MSSDAKQDRQRRRHLLARMAGNVAGGVVAADPFASDRVIARRSVGIAREILVELDRVGE